MAERQGPLQAVVNQDFLIETRSIYQLPERFSLNANLRSSLIALRKWSESLATPNHPLEFEGKEVVGAMFVDENNQIRVRAVGKGNGMFVGLQYLDLSQLPHWQVATILSVDNPSDPEFILVPPGYRWPYPKSPNKIVECGKKTLGFIHVHPNGSPPSPKDLALFTQTQATGILQGVVGKDNLFLFIKTRESRLSSADEEAKINQKIQANYQRLGNLWYAMTGALRETCQNYNLGFYIGSITKGELSKVK